MVNGKEMYDTVSICHHNTLYHYGFYEEIQGQDITLISGKHVSLRLLLRIVQSV